jgi:hypothetical protein
MVWKCSTIPFVRKGVPVPAMLSAVFLQNEGAKKGCVCCRFSSEKGWKEKGWKE